MLYYCYGFVGYYLVGCYMRRFDIIKKLNSLSLRTAIVICLINFVAVMCLLYIEGFILNMTTVEMSDYLSPIPLCITVIALIFLSKAEWISENNNNIVASVAKYSFGIYLFHMIVVFLIYPQITKLMDFSLMSDTVIIMVNILLAMINLFLSYCVVRIISLFPYSKYIIG